MTEIFKAFLLTSAVGALLTLVIVLLKPLTRKLFSASWHYYIWLVVLIVMIFPIKLTLPNEREVHFTNTQVIYSQSSQHSDIEPMLLTYVQPVYVKSQENHRVLSDIDKAAEYVNGFSVTFSYIWIFVAAALVILRILGYILFVLRLHRYSVVISCPKVFQYTRRKITVRAGKNIPSPLITGILRPTLLLPDMSLTDEQLCNILSHEATHLKRNDILYKWFVSFVKCICWFNPVVYFVSRQVNIECEISCDMAVVKKMSSAQKNSYIETILSLISQNKSKPVSLTTGMAGSKKILKRRFAMIKKPFKLSKKTKIISVALAAVILVSAVFISGILNGKLFDGLKNETIVLNTDTRQADAFNTLLLGVDEQGRADTILLMVLYGDDLTGLSIPRDTYIDGRRLSDIAAEENGDQKIVDAIRNNLSVPITYYARVKIDAVKDLVDIAGGLEFYVPMDMKYDDPYKDLTIDLKKGEKILDGDAVTQLLRFRKSNDGTGYANGDLGRIEIGQRAMAKFFEDNSIIDIIEKSKKIADSINKNVVTNYPIEKIAEDKDILLNKKISFMTIPGSTVSRDGKFVYEIDYGRLRNLLSYDTSSRNVAAENYTPEKTVENFFEFFKTGDYNNMKRYCTKKFVSNEFYADRVHAMKTATLDSVVKPFETSPDGNNVIVRVYAIIPAEKPQKEGEFIRTNLNISLVNQGGGLFLIDDFLVQ